MKIFGQILLCIGISSAFSLKAQIMTNNPHQTHFIETSIGRIACYIQHVPHTIPIIFLHGVYYDHNLWQSYASKITDRTVILIDMPLHGMSREIIKGDWDMDDCVNMLKEILDYLDIGKCYAIGHSWGSMTILRAATAFPERFKSIGLCNMPLESGSKGKN